MSEPRKNHADAPHKSASLTRAPKKRYAKPEFKHEKVFETMALACGKLSHTQGQCHFNRKLS